MQKELSDKLIQEFKFFGSKDWGFWGFECQDGWFQLIWDLCEKLKASGFDKRVQQVKEKFGGLRFYVESATNEQWDIIRDAEILSYQTCEYCGEEGEIRNTSWMRTLCDKCFEESEKNES